MCVCVCVYRAVLTGDSDSTVLSWINALGIMLVALPVS